MAERFYIGAKHVQVASDGQGSIIQEVSSQNTLVIERIFIISDGEFAVVNIQDNFGNRYTDADSTNYIPGSNFNDSATDNNTPADLQYPIKIQGNGTLTFTFLDLSSAANDIYITFFGRLDVG